MIDVIVLAMVQGVAEFLPISSSGHLVVLGKLLGYAPDAGVRMNIVLHAGTLLAIAIFYFKELLALLKCKETSLLTALMVGTIPAGIIGIVVNKTGIDELLFNNLLIPGCGFLITAFMLQFGVKAQASEVALDKISIRHALLIGLAQALAITPGISRSGSTIAVGLRLGLRKEDAARFSFLLAMPVIAGATLLEVLSALSETGVGISASAENIALVAGFVTAAIVGYVSLRVLLQILQRGKLHIFSWYLWILGGAVIGWAIIDLLS